MNRSRTPTAVPTLVVLSAALALLLGGTAAAQGEVAAAEILGVETTAAHSRGIAGWARDGSVGEVPIQVRALDASGNPVAGAEVVWTITNATPNLVYAVEASGAMEALPLRVYSARPVVVRGTTDADGIATLVLDSATAGDASIAVTVDGMPAQTYRERDMRVVWF